VTVSKQEEQKSAGKSLWQEIRPYEYAFLALLAAAVHFSDLPGGGWAEWLYVAALATALPVLILRCPDEWRQLPNRLFFFILLAAWIGLFCLWGNPTFGYKDTASLFFWMYDVYTSPLNDEEHGLLIPFLVLTLYWWKRREFVTQPAKLWPAAGGLVLLGLLLHFVGYLIQEQRVSVFAFFLGLYGLTGLAWGKHWLKATLFPFFMFLFCMPVGELATNLTLPLRLLVAQIVTLVAHTGIAPDVIRDGTQIFDAQHTFAYEVAPACSGIRSIVALLAITTIYGFVSFKTPWRRGVMMLAAIPLAILGNVVRLTMTLIVAELFGQAAGKSCETNFGFITFAVAIASILFLGRWLEKGEPVAPVVSLDSPAAPAPSV